MSIDREQRIRLFARRIWESEGRPAGQEERHWYMAVKLVEAEEKVAGSLSARNESPKKKDDQA